MAAPAGERSQSILSPAVFYSQDTEREGEIMLSLFHILVSLAVLVLPGGIPVGLSILAWKHRSVVINRLHRIRSNFKTYFTDIENRQRVVLEIAAVLVGIALFIGAEIAYGFIKP